MRRKEIATTPLKRTKSSLAKQKPEALLAGPGDDLTEATTRLSGYEILKLIQEELDPEAKSLSQISILLDSKLFQTKKIDSEILANDVSVPGTLRDMYKIIKEDDIKHHAASFSYERNELLAEKLEEEGKTRQKASIFPSSSKLYLSSINKRLTDINNEINLYQPDKATLLKELFKRKTAVLEQLKFTVLEIKKTFFSAFEPSNHPLQESDPSNVLIKLLTLLTSTTHLKHLKLDNSLKKEFSVKVLESIENLENNLQITITLPQSCTSFIPFIQYHSIQIVYSTEFQVDTYFLNRQAYRIPQLTLGSGPMKLIAQTKRDDAYLSSRPFLMGEVSVYTFNVKGFLKFEHKSLKKLKIDALSFETIEEGNKLCEFKFIKHLFLPNNLGNFDPTERIDWNDINNVQFVHADIQQFKAKFTMEIENLLKMDLFDCFKFLEAISNQFYQGISNTLPISIKYLQVEYLKASDLLRALKNLYPNFKVSQLILEEKREVFEEIEVKRIIREWFRSRRTQVVLMNWSQFHTNFKSIKVCFNPNSANSESIQITRIFTEQITIFENEKKAFQEFANPLNKSIWDDFECPPRSQFSFLYELANRRKELVITGDSEPFYDFNENLKASIKDSFKKISISKQP